MGQKVGVCDAEKKLPYYKYYEKDLAPIPQEKLDLLDKLSPIPIVPFDQKDLVLEGKESGYCHQGYGILEDGTAFLCNETYIPGGTSKMLDWWFPWHIVGPDLRYKMWNPEDHYFARADKINYVTDPNVPNNEKTWGVCQHILESVGPEPEFIRVFFMKPSDFGYNMDLIGTEKCSSLICGAGEDPFGAAMTHKWYPYEDGVMLISRFWMGYGYKDGKVQRLLPEGMQVPDFAVRALYAHNIKEFTNLAAILPSVYAEEKDNW